MPGSVVDLPYLSHRERSQFAFPTSSGGKTLLIYRGALTFVKLTVFLRNTPSSYFLFYSTSTTFVRGNSYPINSLYSMLIRCGVNNRIRCVEISRDLFLSRRRNELWTFQIDFDIVLPIVRSTVADFKIVTAKRTMLSTANRNRFRRII